MVGLVEILLLGVVTEDMMEEGKADEEKKAAEGGDEVEVERKMEEAGKEGKEEGQADDREPGRDVALDPGWTSSSG